MASGVDLARIRLGEDLSLRPPPDWVWKLSEKLLGVGKG
jgi:hypothetical protein